MREKKREKERERVRQREREWERDGENNKRCTLDNLNIIHGWNEYCMYIFSRKINIYNKVRSWKIFFCVFFTLLK